MKVVSVEEMVALENQANDSGFGFARMMDNAGQQLAEVIDSRYATLQPKHVLGLIGSGNNGGDTLIGLEYLLAKGWSVSAYIVKQRAKNDPLIKELLENGGKIINVKKDRSFKLLREAIASSSVILDGILGTGFKLSLKKAIADSLKVVSSFEKLLRIAAVDCPSGVNCETGETAPSALHADLTICMQAVKKGLLKFPAFEYAGEIVAVDIGITDHLKDAWNFTDEIVDQEMVRASMPTRAMNSHKGTYGTCMIVGGSTNYCGAVLLAAKAAYYSGVGLVRTAIPSAIYDAIAGQLPESTWVILPGTQGVINGDGAEVIHANLDRVNAMLIGPGMGTEKETLDFMQKVLNIENTSPGKMSIGFSDTKETQVTKKTIDQPALVIDAEALRLLARIDGWEKLLSKTAVLTPHPGEMAVLTGLPIQDIQMEREKIARDYAVKVGHVIVLKGAVTVVAAPDGTINYIPIATSALATAGTGDVLAGMITGLIAQGLDAKTAAVSGAWLHARAGLLAAARSGQDISVIASQVLEEIPQVLKEITST